ITSSPGTTWHIVFPQHRRASSDLWIQVKAASLNDDLADREAAKFDNRRPVYEGFKRRVHELLVTLLEHEDLDVIEIQSRVKGSDSFREKLVRKGKHYTDPLNEVTDLVGIRVVVYYQT